MIDKNGFRKWLEDNTSYSKAVIKDIVCRANRADAIKEWDGTETYLFFLRKIDSYKSLNVAVKSQIKKAVELYSLYEKEERA